MEKKAYPKFIGVQSSTSRPVTEQVFDDDDPIIVQSFSEEVKLEDSIRSSIRFCFDHVQLDSSTAQEIPACLYIESGTEGNPISGRPGVDLVLVIDISGSMMGPKIDLVKKTIEFTITKLSPSDRVSLVTFNNSTTRLCPLLSMTDRNKARVILLSNQMKAFGGTELVEGMNVGLKVLAHRKITNSVSSVLLLSDGKDNNSHSALPRAKEILLRSVHEVNSGFSIHTFGYGGDHDATLLNAMAEEKNGGFYFLEQESSIPVIFSNCLGELISVVADNIQVDLEPLPCEIPFELGKVYSETLTRNFRMPPVISGDSKAAVFLLNFPKTIPDIGQALEITPIKATVTYKVMKTGRVYADECFLKIRVFPEGAQIEDIQLDADVMINFYRVKAADVMKEAARVADQGNVAHAKDLLSSCMAELASCIVHDSETLVQIVSDLQEAIQKLPNQAAYEVGGRADIVSKARNHWAKRAVKPGTYQNHTQTVLNIECEDFSKNKH